MDAAKFPQGCYYPVNPAMEDIVSNSCSRPMLEKKVRPQEQINCPRCNSTNTKFCYYNNYSLTQPRYFCKTCRRYWTEGGSLRNVPVGGGSRKNKRSSSSMSSSNSSSSATSKQNIPDLNPPNLSHFSHHHLQNPNNKITTHKGQDLNLAFQVMHENSAHAHHDHMSQYVDHQVPKTDHNNNNTSYTTTSTSSLSALDLLRTGIASRGLNSFIPTPMPPPNHNSNTLFSSSSGFPMQADHDIKPTLSFSIDHHHHHHHGLGNNETAAGRLFFPFGEMKPLSNSTEVVDHHQINKGQQGTSTGYWNGMLGGGSW
ncbi:hypothetical protein LWI29_034704 [Acer saccharum]|uniref:Dof zinc finger protein n=1 Tax=Acer saccharum TaxID=4024 RepID=A0AA39S119_ACESA|nr:hypothetical protein LWI29_034704 [Acer saccharum]KAK1558538.1 hypothetical protein Q3G72_003501 [Acer saccharum]